MPCIHAYIYIYSFMKVKSCQGLDLHMPFIVLILMLMVLFVLMLLPHMACNSILNTSAYFHVIDGMVPDIMHDILEGSLQLHLKCLLKYCILRMKYFSLNTVNTRIHSFYFGTADTANRPSDIATDVLTSSSNSVKQSCKFMDVSWPWLAN